MFEEEFVGLATKCDKKFIIEFPKCSGTKGLLTRDNFRNSVFERDNHLCVVCGDEAQDAHHIIERRLFPDGGYYLSNGASVCGPCHIKAESTEISVEELRQRIGCVSGFEMPPDIYDDAHIDKWGNDISETDYYIRYPGPLAEDESVLKILRQCPRQIQFRNHRKYPRTPHLPGSPSNVGQEYTWDFKFSGEVIVTEKMDGENTTMYSDKVHARSIDSRHHASQDMMKSFWAERCGEIPIGMRICGEYLYAKHSIAYDSLPSFFMGISVWDGPICLSWSDTLEWFELLDIVPVPVLAQIGPALSPEHLVREARTIWENETGGVDRSEGFVIRSADSFGLKQFNDNIGKWVRPNHVDASRHWRHKGITPNKVISG